MTGQPKDAGHRAPNPDADRDRQDVAQLLGVAGLLRQMATGERVTVDAAALADLVEHTAAIWSDGVYARHQWPAHRQLVAALAAVEVAP